MKAITCNIHLLPTEKVSDIRLNTSLKLIDDNISDYGIETNSHLTFAHLYFTVPQQEGVEISKIRERYWCYKFDLLGKIFKWKNTTNTWYNNSEKVIATTDVNLKVKGEQAGENAWYNPLPSIPENFIKYFIKEYNKGNIIKTVNVEIEYICANGHSMSYHTACVYPNCNLPNKENISLSDNNEISVVMLTINKEKLYTRAEVILLCQKCAIIATKAERNNTDFNEDFLIFVETEIDTTL